MFLTTDTGLLAQLVERMAVISQEDKNRKVAGSNPAWADHFDVVLQHKNGAIAQR